MRIFSRISSSKAGSVDGNVALATATTDKLKGVSENVLRSRWPGLLTSSTAASPTSLLVGRSPMETGSLPTLRVVL